MCQQTGILGGPESLSVVVLHFPEDLTAWDGSRDPPAPEKSESKQPC